MLRWRAPPAFGESDGAPSADWIDDLRPIPASDWNYERAAHLIERAGFGATPSEIRRLAAMSPGKAVKSIVDYESIDASGLAGFDESRMWDPGMDPFPPSRAEAVRVAREKGSALGVAVLPEGSSRRIQPVVDKFFYGLRANVLETRRLALWWAGRMVKTPRQLEEYEAQTTCLRLLAPRLLAEGPLRYRRDRGSAARSATNVAGAGG